MRKLHIYTGLFPSPLERNVDLLHLLEPNQHTYMRHAQALSVSAVDLYRAH
jgi:hypothetical protein